MASRPKKPRKRRYLLTAVALSTGTLLSGCGSAQDDGPGGSETTDGVEGEVLPLPANPKGAVYDEGTAAGPDENVAEEETGEEETGEEEAGDGDEGATEGADETDPPRPRPHPEPNRPLPLPANPKGAHYDDGPFAPTPNPAPSEE